MTTGGHRIGPGPIARLASLAVALFGALGLVAGAVAAETDADEAEGLAARVTAVDATGSQVWSQLLTDQLDPEVVTVREGGAEVEADVTTADAAGVAAEVVFVVDVDNRNVGSGVLAGFVTGVDEATASFDDRVRVGAVSAGAEAELVARLTAQHSGAVADLRARAAERGAAIQDAVVLAAESFSDTPGRVRTVVVLTGGADTASTGSVEAAETALIQAGAQLVSVTVGPTPNGLARLTERSGGAALVSPTTQDDSGAVTIDRDGLAETLARAAAVAADRLPVSPDTEAEPGQRPNVEIAIDGQTLSFSYPVGVRTTNALQLAPNLAGPQQEGGLFGHPAVLYSSVILAFLAISAGLWSLASMYAGGDSSLDKVLARYSEQDETLDDDDVQEMLVQTALIQRAVALTENFAERRGFLTRVEEMLERANLPVRAGEAMFFLSLAVLGVSVGGLLITGSLFVAAILGVVTAGLGYAGLQLAARRRLKAFEAQLPDTLQLLAGTLRAGYSLPQGIDAVSHEIDDPMGHELRRAMTEAQLGRELEDALTNIAERLDSPDFAWAVMAVGIQREVGGNLAEVLLTVAETMIQRERLKREVAALTAEGRVSAAILSMLPPGLGFVMWVMNPSYVGVLFSRTIGLVLIGLAVVSGLVGLAWMKKVITIDA